MTTFMGQTDDSITRIYLIEEKLLSTLGDGLQTQEGYTPWGPYAGGSFGWSKSITIDGSVIRLGINYFHGGYGYKQRPGIEGPAGQTLCHYQAELVPDRAGITPEVRGKALDEFRATLLKYFTTVEEKTE